MESVHYRETVQCSLTLEWLGSHNFRAASCTAVSQILTLQISCHLSVRRSRPAALLITINHVAPALQRISTLFMNIGAGAELPDRGSGWRLWLQCREQEKETLFAGSIIQQPMRKAQPAAQKENSEFPLNCFVFSDVQELMFDLALLLVSVEFGSDCLIPLISQKWQLSGSELSFHISSSSLP